MERQIYIFCCTLKKDLLCYIHGRRDKVMRQFIAIDGYIICGITGCTKPELLFSIWFSLLTSKYEWKSLKDLFSSGFLKGKACRVILCLIHLER